VQAVATKHFLSDNAIATQLLDLLHVVFGLIGEESLRNFLVC
jgi:predicted metal-dependent hydrolase